MRIFGRFGAAAAAVALLGVGCVNVGTETAVGRQFDGNRNILQRSARILAPATETQESATTEAPRYELVGNSCTAEQCLFNINQSFYPIGVAKIRGHFVAREVELYEKKICDSFVVTGGASEFIRAILALVDARNTVNAKNEKNQPIVNLSLDGLTVDEKQMIKQSNGSKEVSLVIVKELQPGDFGAPACFSDFKIVRVSKP